MKNNGTYLSYIAGFILSLVLTLIACGLVFINTLSGHAVFSHEFLRTIVILLAVLQLAVQCVFFLRLGRGAGQGGNLVIFSFMLILVAIIVGGSLWIMKNLNYNMTPTQMDAYMIGQSE
jgi:cytochrome o ubiquinol oxidase operon protein cyoD